MRRKEYYGPAVMRRVFCAIVGHSKIITNCFGYISCARCEAQIGDTLGGIWRDDRAVLFEHNCTTCADNYKKLSWKDRLFVRYPFSGEPIASPKEVDERNQKRFREAIKARVDPVDVERAIELGKKVMRREEAQP